MLTSVQIKTSISSWLYHTGITNLLLRRYFPEKSAILMYHRVLPGGTLPNGIQPGMYVFSETFERHISFLKKSFSLVSLEQLHASPNEEGRQGLRPKCALTFDDGWKDFYEQAFPILKSQQVPATVFLPTDFIGTKKWFWTDRLASLLMRVEDNQAAINSGKKTDNPLADNILHLPGSLNAKIEAAICLLKPRRQDEIEEILRKISFFLSENLEPSQRAFVSWDEAREMFASGLVSFGSHTTSHRILTTLEVGEIQNELSESKAKLIEENVVLPEFIPFCYPNGNYNDQITRMVQNAGYSLALSTDYGWVGKEDDVFALKRIPIHNDMTSTEPLFSCRMIGLW
jgi:peptidoglycan/xylan/chitin deacetylase (PgdA/CDA1 family)